MLPRFRLGSGRRRRFAPVLQPLLFDIANATRCPRTEGPCRMPPSVVSTVVQNDRACRNTLVPAPRSNIRYELRQSLPTRMSRCVVSQTGSIVHTPPDCSGPMSDGIDSHRAMPSSAILQFPTPGMRNFRLHAMKNAALSPGGPSRRNAGRAFFVGSRRCGHVVGSTSASSVVLRREDRCFRGIESGRRMPTLRTFTSVRILRRRNLACMPNDGRNAIGIRNTTPSS